MKKTIIVPLVALLAVSGLCAAPFTADVSRFDLYDASGREMPISESSAEALSAGWIVRTREIPVTITTPLGTLRLEPSASLVTGRMTSEEPSLYLVDGIATISTASSFAGTLTVSTPVTKYTLGRDTEILIETTGKKEEVTSFRGEVVAIDGITGRRTVVKANEKYDFASNVKESVMVPVPPDSEIEIPAPMPPAPLFTQTKTKALSINPAGGEEGAS